MATLIDDLHGPVTYSELVTSLTSQYVNNELVVKREFLVPWESRWIFARKMLGYHYLDRLPGATGRFIHRVTPQSFTPQGIDDYTNPQEKFNLLYCSSLESMEPVRPKEWDPLRLEGVNLYAKCAFTYRYLPYAVYADLELQNAFVRNPDPLFGNQICDVRRVGTELIPMEVVYPQDTPVQTVESINAYCYNSVSIVRYISKQAQPSAQHLVLPQGRMYFVDGAATKTPATNITTKLISKTEVVYTWHFVPTSDITGSSQVKKVQKYVGSVNQYAFDGYLPQTLLLTAINSKPFRQIGGHYTTDIEMRMTYFEVLERYRTTPGIIPLVHDEWAIGHNYFLRFTPEAIWKKLNSNTASEAEKAEWLHLGYRYDLLTQDGTKTGRRLYPAKDFYELFQPA